MGEVLRVDYVRLFSVEVLHCFYLNRGEAEFEGLSSTARRGSLGTYDVGDFLTVRPTADTKRELARHRLLFRPTALGFEIVAPRKADGTLTFPLELELRLRFFARTRERHLLDITSLPMGAAERDVLLWSTDADHIETKGDTTLLFLTRPLLVFDPSSAYRAGSVIVDEDAVPTRRLTATQDIAPSATLDEEQWTESTTVRVASDADRVPLSDGSFLASVAPATPTHVHATVEDRDRRMVAETSVTGTLQEPVTDVPVDVRGTRPGLYRLRLRDPGGAPIAMGGVAVPDADLSFYVDDQLMRDPVFAVIEIGASSDDYRLVDENGVLQSPTFRVNLANRWTFWRYTYAAEFDADRLAQLTEPFEPIAGSPDQIMTRKAQPLTRGLVDLKPFPDSHPLPNPTESTGVRPDAPLGRLFSRLFVPTR